MHQNDDLADDPETADLPEQLAPAELAYHAVIMRDLRWARETARRIAQAEAAAVGWSEHLHERYGLDATAGEGVTDDGKIVRAEVAPPA